MHQSVMMSYCCPRFAHVHRYSSKTPQRDSDPGVTVHSISKTTGVICVLFIQKDIRQGQNVRPPLHTLTYIHNVYTMPSLAVSLMHKAADYDNIELLADIFQDYCRSSHIFIHIFMLVVFCAPLCKFRKLNDKIMHQKEHQRQSGPTATVQQYLE